MSNVRTKTNR